MQWLIKNWITLLITSVVILILHYFFGDKLTAFFRGKNAGTAASSNSAGSKATVYPPPSANQKLQALANVNVRTSPSSAVSSNIAFTTAKNDVVGLYVSTVPAEPMSPDKGNWYWVVPVKSLIANPFTTYYVYADLVKPI